MATVPTGGDEMLKEPSGLKVLLSLAAVINKCLLSSAVTLVSGTPGFSPWRAHASSSSSSSF